MDQCLRHRPFAKPCSGIQVTDFAKVDEPTAPVFRHRRDTLELRERIVAACTDNAWKRQRLSWNWLPTILSERIEGWIACRQRRLKVGRSGEQCTVNLAAVLLGPMHRDHHARAMRDQDHR